MSKTYQTLIALMLSMLITMSLTAAMTSLLMQIDTNLMIATIVVVYIAAFVTCMKMFEEERD